MMPVYDKPMIYYPLSVLMLAGIREVLIISTPHDLPGFQKLLGDGSQWGISFSYAAQPNPGGLAQAYLIGADFLAGQPSVLILGDNIYYGNGMEDLLSPWSVRPNGATVFAYHVTDPERYGIVEMDEYNMALSIEEKPAFPKSNWAVTGLYCCDGDATAIADGLNPSARGELEITDLLNVYLSRGVLEVQRMGRGFAWFDMGTHDSLLEASSFVQTLVKRQGLRIAVPEEIAYEKGFITFEDFIRLGKKFAKSTYGQYLLRVAAEKDRPTTAMVVAGK